MRFLADENFRGDILRGILAEFPDLDVLRVQDTSFSGISDEKLLEVAAQQDAILLTHDVQTITKFAYARIKAGLIMPGVVEVAQDTPTGQAIADLIVLIGTGEPADFKDHVWYVPMH